MADMTPVHSPSAPDIYRELESRSKSGTLADEKEYTTEEDKAREDQLATFKVLSSEELTKLKKDELLEYIQKKDAYDKEVLKRKLKEEADASRQAAVHGFTRQPVGELLKTGRKRGIPEPLMTDEGKPRLNKKGLPVTRTDW